MRVVFLYPAWTGTYGIMGYFARRNSTWPPLNLALLGAITEQHGHECHIVDGEADGLTIAKLVERTRQIDPDIIGLTTYTPFFHINVALAEALKEAGLAAKIVVGGPHMTIMKEKAFVPAFDYGVVGEAEKSWPEFLERIENGGDIGGVKGIIYRRNGEVVATGRPDPMPDPSGEGHPLDQFPMPARHLLPMQKYRLGTLKGRLPMTSIQTTRGCPWRCIFCASDALETTRVVRRSPRSVVDEMKSVVNQFGIRHFYVVDDVLTLWPEHIRDICNLIIEEGLDITFEGSTRANLIVDEKLVALMAKSGLIRLSFGLETVDSEMRKTMKKKVPLEYYERANKICNKYKIEALNSVMIGLPGETRESVRKTLTWLRNAREVKQANFAIAVPYPGTEFHEMAVSGEHGVDLMTKDFSNYRRYGSAVTKVGDLTPDDLVELQNEGFISIYSAPWRWMPMLGKHGAIGGGLMMLRIASLVFNKFFPSRKRMHKYVSSGDGSLTAVRDTGFAAAAPAGHYGNPKNPNMI